MGLPMAQVVFILLRQLSKPVSDRLMSYGRAHPGFRNILLIPMGRAIFKMTTRIRLSYLGLGKPTQIAPVTEETALDQAAEFVQQLTLLSYSIGIYYGYTVYMGYLKRNEQPPATREEVQQLRFEMDTISRRMNALAFNIDEVLFGGTACGRQRNVHSSFSFRPHIDDTSNNKAYIGGENLTSTTTATSGIWWWFWPPGWFSSSSPSSHLPESTNPSLQQNATGKSSVSVASQLSDHSSAHPPSVLVSGDNGCPGVGRTAEGTNASMLTWTQVMERIQREQQKHYRETKCNSLPIALTHHEHSNQPMTTQLKEQPNSNAVKTQH